MTLWPIVSREKPPNAAYTASNDGRITHGRFASVVLTRTAASVREGAWPMSTVSVMTAMSLVRGERVQRRVHALDDGGHPRIVEGVRRVGGLVVVRVPVERGVGHHDRREPPVPIVEVIREVDPGDEARRVDRAHAQLGRLRHRAL